MFEKFQREPNFIEKRRQWKGELDKPVGRRMLMIMLPAIILCVFALMSAPYLKAIFETFADGEELRLKSISLEEPSEPKAAAESPVSPEVSMAQFYRDRYDREGFDWRNKPQVERQATEHFARDLEIEVSPLGVELPVTMAELERASLESGSSGSN